MGVEVASSADAGVERGTLATAEGLLSGAMMGDVREPESTRVRVGWK